MLLPEHELARMVHYLARRNNRTERYRLDPSDQKFKWMKGPPLWDYKQIAEAMSMTVAKVKQLHAMYLCGRPFMDEDQAKLVVDQARRKKLHTNKSIVIRMAK